MPYDINKDHHILIKKAWFRLKEADPKGAEIAKKFQKKFRGFCHYECECILAYLSIFSTGLKRYRSAIMSVDDQLKRLDELVAKMQGLEVFPEVISQVKFFPRIARAKIIISGGDK